MKKLLLLSVLLIFACSSDDSSSNDDNNNCIEGRWDLVSRTVDGFQRLISDCEQQTYIEITNENIIFEPEDNNPILFPLGNNTILFPQSIKLFKYGIEDSNCLEGITSSESIYRPIFLNATSSPNIFNILTIWQDFGEFDPFQFDIPELIIINTAICNDNTLTIYQQNFFEGGNFINETFNEEIFEVYIRN